MNPNPSKTTGKTTVDEEMFETLWGEKMNLTDVIDVLEMLRDGFLKHYLTETELAEASYVFDIAKCNGELQDNGLPKCVDVYLATLIRLLAKVLDRINEMLEPNRENEMVMRIGDDE